jgi:hypothetical protein
MRDLESFLPLSDLSNTLGLPEAVIDSLVESGRILCRLTGGEIVVPLSEVEGVLRDALLRLYAAESREQLRRQSTGRESSETWSPSTLHAVAAAEPLESASIPLPGGESPAAPEPRQFGDDPVEAAADASDSAVHEPVQDEAAGESPSVIVAPRDREREREWDRDRELERFDDARPDHRRATRYVPLRQITGIFNDIKFTVLQLSATGLRIRHNGTLLPGDEAKLTFAMLRTARSVVVRARVVWTSVARSGDEQFSISGLRVIEHADRLEHAVQTMKAVHELQPERRVTSRRSDDAVSMLRNVSDEEMALVTSAIHKFASDPVEAGRWYSRARFALSDENIRRAAPQRGAERDEVLGIWEYLDRQVELEKVAGVMRWIRS